MPITAVPNPATLSWGNFTKVESLPVNEDAHIDMDYQVQNRPIRRVGGQFMLAETLEVRVRPRARVLKTANQTDDLLAHEQGHYDIGLLAGRALARDLAGLSAATPAELGTAANDAFTLHTRTRLKPIQEAYDGDTKHSADPTEQKRWAGLISAALAAAAATHVNNMPL